MAAFRRDNLEFAVRRLRTASDWSSILGVVGLQRSSSLGVEGATTDQTNVNFFQVTAIVGTRMVEVRAIAQADANTGKEAWATGNAMPALDAFTGVPPRRRVDGRRRTMRIDDVRTAHVWDGRPQGWTAYA